MIDVRGLLRRVAGTCAVAALCTGSALAQPGPERRDERAAPAPGSADFDHVNPGLGFGWFGLSDVPIGPGGTDAVRVPVIGVRWWTGAPLGPFRAWGLDLGIGVGRTSTDSSPTDVTRTGLLFHAGLPLVVSAIRHVAIEFVPEVNLGYASGENADGTDVGGTRFDLGARAGAEIFFGFMGLPQLSLEGSVGLFFSRESRSVQPPGAREASAKTWSFGTTVHDQPWDIFRSSVAARYYF